MTTHYQDIRLIYSEGIPAPVLMGHIFERAHRRICDFGVGHIALSFPEMDVTLGPLLRLHGTPTSLEGFGLGWLGSLGRMVRTGGIFTAPPEASPCVFKRKQPRAGGDRWLRRWCKRHEGVPDLVPPQESLKAPFVALQSRSSGHRLVLHIVKSAAEGANPTPNGYGLGSAVPLF